jgi:hypothetical protein
VIVTGFGGMRQCVAWLTRYAASVRSWLAVLVLLGACTDHGAERLARIKSDVCACKTVSCAEDAMKGVPKEAIQSTHRTQTIARDMLDCLAKLTAAERPVTDPDAEDSAEEPAAPGRPPRPPAPPAVAPPGAPPTLAPPAPARKP